MHEGNNIIQGRGRSLIFASGKSGLGFCQILPAPREGQLSIIKKKMPSFWAWAKKEFQNQEKLVDETKRSERTKRIARLIIEYHFRSVDSLRFRRKNQIDSFDVFETELRKEIISLGINEAELIKINLLCIRAIPWNYFHPSFLLQDQKRIQAKEESILQIHSGNLFPFQNSEAGVL
jgi:hypothetical protein